MSLETDLLLDRRRLKRRLNTWRVIAILAVAGAAIVAAGHAGWSPVRAHVARIGVDGIITSDRDLLERVARLGRDRAVRAVIVDIDSPGGSVAGGEQLHDALVSLAARKPVVTLMEGTAASAGYMIALPAARIFAREATLTGSIGVILQTGEASGLLEKLGITAEAITSGPLKGEPSPTKPLSDQGRSVLHGLVMDLYDQFVGMVATARHMSPDHVRELADGRAYTGRQALALGLVDEIGGEAEARTWLAAHGVPADLPVEDVKARSFTDRTLGASLGGLLGFSLKTLSSQYLSLDGAWLLWHPRPGED